MGVCVDRGRAGLGCEMGSAMPPGWEVSPAATWGELGPALDTSPIGSPVSSYAGSVLHISVREVLGHAARKKGW